MQPAPRAPHPARAARSCGRNLLNRLLPRAPATAGSPNPRRRGRTGPDASFPAARVAAVPQPDSRSPVPAAGPLTCTCLRKWRGPGTASGQKQQQQQQQRGWPRHLAHGTTRAGAGSRGALGRSVRQSLPPPYAASAALAPAAPGHTSLWPNLSPAPGPHPPLRPQKHHPSLPPACLRRRRRLSTAATAAALRNRGPGQPRSSRHDGLRHVT